MCAAKEDCLHFYQQLQPYYSEVTSMKMKEVCRTENL